VSAINEEQEQCVKKRQAKTAVRVCVASTAVCLLLREVLSVPSVGATRDELPLYVSDSPARMTYMSERQ
jgi:hypothetical protein